MGTDMAPNEFELQSMVSLDDSKSKTGSDTGTLPRLKWKNSPLHERCSTGDMLRLREAFLLHQDQLLPNQFRTLLRELLNVEYDDDEFKILFMKINSARDGVIDWDELVSHLILGYFGNDPENQRGSLQPPILGLPTIMRSQHRHPVSRICFCPDVGKDRTTDPMQGSYVTASRDGMIHWWSLDLRLLRTAMSSSPHLKVRQTWVTDMACMPDINIVVTSSTERDLRFYDCTAKTFVLKLIITSWSSMICTMHYVFHKDPSEKCMLVCGDVGGNVRLLRFSPEQRGPFRNQPGRAYTQLMHADLQKRPHLLPGMTLTEFPKVHSDWVRQVSYYESLHCLVSCATCPDSLLMCDVAGSRIKNMFRVEKGIQCFAFDEESHMLVTGGPDCTVRVWNSFVTAKPSQVFPGHHAGIISLVLQQRGQRIYSLSRDRVIKVWDVQGQTCLQTYIEIPSQVGEQTPITTVYNRVTREYILAAIKMAVVILDETLNPLHTDGFTHSKAVSKVLYNPLFKVVLTCGMDSIIICWDPLTGKRMAMIREAHTRLLHGELQPVEITCACFDPGYQLLLTGARNGELKVWNFNTGLCLRMMSIEHMCEVTSVFWVEGRILAVGWNQHIVEFEDSGTAATGKAWENRHSDDVLAAAARPPLSVVTCSYNSELIMWKMETGQPYRRFSCTEPTLRIKMSYNKREPRILPTLSHQPSLSKGTSFIKRQSGNATVDLSAAVERARSRQLSMVPMPPRAQEMRHLAVHACIFLQNRPQHSKVASLLVALENGQVQCWSDHPAGGFQGSFQAVHTAGDHVSAFETDINNEFLFCGTTVGYVKVWLMTNFMTNVKVHVCMPRLRLEFPFLWRDRVCGRAKRSVSDQPLPLLLNSYRAHLRSITTLSYIDDHKLLLSGSSDYSVRGWRLSGEYLGTLGSFVPWSLEVTRVPPDVNKVASSTTLKVRARREYLGTLGSFVPWSLEVTRVPPDVNKVASSTTLKVWQHGEVSRYTPGLVEVDKLRDITDTELRTRTFGRAPSPPLLGHYFALPTRSERLGRIDLDDSLPTIPLYCHLRMASTVPVRRPPTPELVRLTRLKRAPQRKAHFDPARPALVAPPPLPHASSSAHVGSFAPANTTKERLSGGSR